MTELKRDFEKGVLDVVVIAARAEEREALCAQFAAEADEAASRAVAQKVRHIPVYAFPHDHLDVPCSVGIMECAEMGNVVAAARTAYALIRYEPALVIFSGIAGSLDSSKIRIGDVIFPRNITTRYFQKLKSLDQDCATLSVNERTEVLEAIKGRLHCNMKTVSISRLGMDLLNHLSSSRLTGLLANEEIPPEWVQDKKVVNRRVTVLREESAFCWDKVLSNPDYVSFLRNAVGGNVCTTVDMESYGFLRAMEEVASSELIASQGMVVRAVSDFAQHKELSDSEPRWRDLALKNMSIATLYVIRDLYPKVFGGVKAQVKAAV